MKKTFKEITRDIDMVLFNQITEVSEYLELEAWNDFDSENDRYKEIFQYFAINRTDWEYLSRITWMPLYYSNECDLFVLWVDFLDNWENLSYEI